MCKKGSKELDKKVYRKSSKELGKKVLKKSSMELVKKVCKKRSNELGKSACKESSKVALHAPQCLVVPHFSCIVSCRYAGYLECFLHTFSPSSMLHIFRNTLPSISLLFLRTVGAWIRGQNGTIIVNCDFIKCMLFIVEWWLLLWNDLIVCVLSIVNVPVTVWNLIWWFNLIVYSPLFGNS